MSDDSHPYDANTEKDLVSTPNERSGGLARKAKITFGSVRFGISLIALIALSLHLIGIVKFTWESLVLAFFILFPWLPAIIKSAELGKDRASMNFQDFKEEIRESVEDAKEVAQNAKEVAQTAKVTAMGNFGQTLPKEMLSASKIIDAKTPAITNPLDPQKGRWGGKEINNGRKISAEIKKIEGNDFNRKVIVKVESTDPSSHPLTGKVIFHLHPTFIPPEYDEDVIDGVAETELVSYGAFTIGAEADGGKTKLEFDLTTLDKDGKDPFFKR
jgi:hypothetical protein